MAKTTVSAATPLQQQLDRLAAFEPGPFPVVSLYLDLRPDQHGRDNYDVFLRDQFPRRAASFNSGTPERESLDKDLERITGYLRANVESSKNGLALFACSGKDDFFEAIPLDAPVGENWLYVGPQPHLYPLARLNDQYPRYATLLIDTNSAQLVVFALGSAERREEVQGTKTRRTSIGGWSQNRYQRRVENFHLRHVKEVVGVLDRVVRAENVQHIIVGGDEVAVPLLKEQLPKHLAEKVVDVVSADLHAPEREVLEQSLAALRRRDAESDHEKVDELLGAWRANGLAVVGARDALKALDMGQVDELILSASPELLKQQKSGAAAASAPDPARAADLTVPMSAVDGETIRLADELVRKAQQTAARIRFIEDRSLLASVGGVGALLRFKI